MSRKGALRHRSVLASILLVTAAVVSCVACASTRPTDLGAHEGRLSPCPSSPNCVNSQAAEGDEHFVAPLEIAGDPVVAWSDAVRAAKALPRSAVVEERDGYLWLEVRSLVFRFVDDLELVRDATRRRIDVRSCSRVGHSDFGVNRARVEALREAYAQARESAK